MKSRLSVLFILVFLFFMYSCESTRVDVKTDINADTGISNVDVEAFADKLAISIIEQASEIKGKTIALMPIENRTSEHLDTDMIGDKIKDMIKKHSGAKFVERSKIDLVFKEQSYAQFTGEHVQEANKLWGADYLMYGFLTSIKKVDKGFFSDKEESYFRLSLKLTNTTTAVEVWSDQAEFKKVQRKSAW